MRIPEIQAELRSLAALYDSPRLLELADTLSRKPRIGRAPRASRAMCSEVIQEIKEYAGSMPNLTQMEIAIAVGVSQGRVSEVLSGKRY